MYDLKMAIMELLPQRNRENGECANPPGFVKVKVLFPSRFEGEDEVIRYTHYRCVGCGYQLQDHVLVTPWTRVPRQIPGPLGLPLMGRHYLLP